MINELKTSILFLFLLPFLLSVNSSIYFQDITQDHGLSNMGFTSICEDENGFIWFGGPNGLYYHNTINIEKVKLYNQVIETSTPTQVNTLYKDHDNAIWICTNKGLIKRNPLKKIFEYKNPVYKGNNKNATKDIQNIVRLDKSNFLVLIYYKLFLYNEVENTIKPYAINFGSSIRYLDKDENENIFVGTRDGKLFELQKEQNDYKLIYQLQNHIISSVCKVENNYFLGFRDNGVILINNRGEKIKTFNSRNKGRYHIKNDHVREIIELSNGQIWIATNEGIYVLENDKTILLDSRLETGLPHRRIFYMQKGLNDKIWVSTYAGGLSFYSPYNYKFKHIKLDYPHQQLDRSHVSTICEDSKGNIWIGSEDEGSIKIYSTVKKNFINEIPQSLLDSLRDLKIIISISDEQIAFCENESNILNIYNYKKHMLESQIEFTISSYIGIRGALLFNNTLWVYSPKDLIAYDLKTKRIIKTLKTTPRIWSTLIDSSNNLWVCTTQGLYVLKPDSEQLELCPTSEKTSIAHYANIYSACEYKNGEIWFGTTSNGAFIYHTETQTTSRIPDHQLTTDAAIYRILKDYNDDIWYITNKGLYQYNSKLKRTNFHGTNNGTLNAQNRLNSCLLSSTGKLYFGAKSGFTIVDPSAIRQNKTKPRVFLSEFKTNNKPYMPDSIKGSFDLTHLRKATLNANDNDLILNVISNNYLKPERNRFRYRLVNYNNRWTNTTHGKDIVFTKVPPGKYVFEAYGSNNDDVWSEAPYRLEIKIRHPFLLRWYAFLFYLILTVLISWWVYLEVKTKLQLRREIEATKNKSKVNELLHEERIKLFTNISHELRTPLSLIVSPINYILDNSSVEPNTKHLLEVVNRNAKRLQKTADQTIDFRLLEIGKLTPHFKSNDIVALCKDIYGCFEQQFLDRQIQSSFNSAFKSLHLDIDGDMIEKIIYNLLSNALKYTPEGESINLSIEEQDITLNDIENKATTGKLFEGKAIGITIKDTGSGIDEKLLPNIFKRFSKGKHPHLTSTGIGLHLCSEYAAMNNSFIQLSTQNGRGTSFTLNIPLKGNYKAKKSELKQLVIENSTYQERNENDSNSNNKATILIVEDHGELRDFLKSLLSKNYKIFTAKHGKQALTQLDYFTPDLILTDIAMPLTDGFELIKNIKQSKEHQNIPIIVMTAHAERNLQMKSILVGAHAFLTKPIDQQMLQALIRNILTRKNIQNEAETQKPNKKPAESFTTKATKIVEKNLHNQNFNISDLLRELNISKTTLTRKLKAETQLNASGFIREIRLENAKKLLHNNTFSIEEISNYVGFKYSSYFVKSFKDKYGLTPNEYRKLKK